MANFPFSPKISLQAKNEEIDRNRQNGPKWVSHGDVNCEGWSNEAISKKMGLAWQRGRECLSVYLAGINLVSISTTLYFSFSFSFFILFFFFFINKIWICYFFFFLYVNGLR